MRIIRLVTLFLFFSTLFSSSACQSTLSKPNNQDEKILFNKEWILFKLNNLFVPPPIGSYPRLMFYKDSAIIAQGNTGCNEFKAVINLKSSQIKFLNFKVDSIKCMDQQEAELEKTLVKVLQQANKWQIEDKKLLYFKKDNKILVIFIINSEDYKSPPTKEN